VQGVGACRSGDLNSRQCRKCVDGRVKGGWGGEEGMEVTGWERVVYMCTPLAPVPLCRRVIVGGVFEVR
jgi:hypothetical protein